ncbi:MAG: glycoside hydrolase family 99-like domain-containing protein [Phycisphaeraceae bacterium]
MLNQLRSKAGRAIGVLLMLGVGGQACAQATVGAFYYPWWKGNPGHVFEQSLRGKLTPQAHDPLAGDYDSQDMWAIAQHIDQSQAGNISLWVNSWWGPGRFSAQTLEDHILTHPLISRVKQAVLYESQGRLGSFDAPDYSNLSTDFDYLAQHVFSDPNYMRIDGKPVVYLYLSRVYFKDAAGRAALDAVRQQVLQDHGMQLYLIGDHVFGSVAGQAQGLDAIAAYDVYGQSYRPDGATLPSGTQRLANNFAAAANKPYVQNNDVDLIPTISPGYNDKAVRDGNPAAPRYYENLGTGTVGQPFLDQITQAALPHVDADTGNLILVNSFNEWHEDTQIEPTITAGFTSTDTSPTNQFTQGKSYEGYGSRYLDILRQQTGGPAEYELYNGVFGDVNQDGVLTVQDVNAMGEHWEASSAGLPLKQIAMRGDWDLNGNTNFFDLQLLVAALNDAGTPISLADALYRINPIPGDTDYDGDVDDADLATAFANYHRTHRLGHQAVFPGRHGPRRRRG